MNKYGQSAIRAVNLIQSSGVPFTEDAWKIATSEIFTTATKACPRSSFLGLCEAGLIKGVEQTHIKNALKLPTINKDHAIDAIKLLSESESLSNSKPLELWRIVMRGNPKSHNFQMDVVLALWKHNLVIPGILAPA